MLTAFGIENFKAFSERQRIPLRPITLIFGANSSGKSSIIHALALAHHAAEEGDLDVNRTRVGGGAIDLGGFRQYVHRRDVDRQVSFSFELDPTKLSGRVGEVLTGASKLEVEVGFGLQLVKKLLMNDSTLVRKFDLPSFVETFTIAVDDLPLLRMSVRKTRALQLDMLNPAHPVLRRLIEGIVLLVTTTQKVSDDDFKVLTETLAEIVPGIKGHVEGLFPRLALGEGQEKDQAADYHDTLVPVSRGRRGQDLARVARLFLPKVLGELVDGLGTAIAEDIRKLEYLGPLRSYPPRHLVFSQDEDDNWHAGGGYAWDVIRTDATTRERVNLWLGDENRLKTPYELELREMVSLDDLWKVIPGRLEKVMHDLVVRVLAMVGEDDVGVLDLIEYLKDEFNLEEALSLGDSHVEEIVASLVDPGEFFARCLEVIEHVEGEIFTDVVLIDRRSGTLVSHRDVGIGVSQVLPVLVLAFASEQKLIAIEQPEIHLHPALQAELGDVFLESALGKQKNTFLIETHSEHLLLRIMRRMRETSEGELPDGFPKIRPEDVMVLFVEPEGSRSVVREMPLNERGELVKAWPGGFFEEGLREIF